MWREVQKPEGHVEKFTLEAGIKLRDRWIGGTGSTYRMLLLWRGTAASSLHCICAYKHVGGIQTLCYCWLHYPDARVDCVCVSLSELLLWNLCWPFDYLSEVFDGLIYRRSNTRTVSFFTLKLSFCEAAAAIGLLWAESKWSFTITTSSRSRMGIMYAVCLGKLFAVIIASNEITLGLCVCEERDYWRREITQAC